LVVHEKTSSNADVNLNTDSNMWKNLIALCTKYVDSARGWDAYEESPKVRKRPRLRSSR